MVVLVSGEDRAIMQAALPDVTSATAEIGGSNISLAMEAAVDLNVETQLGLQYETANNIEAAVDQDPALIRLEAYGDVDVLVPQLAQDNIGCAVSKLTTFNI